MNPSYQPYFHDSGGPTVQDITTDASGSTVYHAEDTMSTTFKPGNVFDGMFSDMAITSCDYTVYYVHRQHLTRMSLNAFGGLLVNISFSKTVPEPAAVVDIVLHTIYGISYAHRYPSLDTIEAALSALVKYGITLQHHASPSQSLYPLLMSHAPYRPIDAYAVAGKWGLEDAAVAISAHLLAFDLSRISDELSVKIGPLYLRRLFDLHRNRASALKNIVLRPPGTHPPTMICTEESQARLTSAWAFSVAQLMWATLPGMSTNALQSMFGKAGNGIICEDCQATLQARIQEICRQWSEVKRTI